MSQKKKFFLIFPAALLLALLLWLWLPRSIYRISGIDPGSVSRASMTVIQGVYEGGQTDFLNLQVDTQDLEPEVLAELMEILEGKGYRPCLGNLLPGKSRELSAQGSARNASIVLLCDADPVQICQIAMLEPKQLGISEGGGFGLYRPLDQELLEKLCTFARNHGGTE